ncbi:hypothetical protein EYB25_007666 [Talaromyces marneffei]|uniref:Uncharacterized protein n=1 Tax=Talaromyces marneffei PM1 TaxID=1077442 RepID=A0A093VEH8_TALMA|nr:uncharacterized protein EYB26_005200 [Talaromyces marneffei]KAE8549151.1 hypothetical protein EYB25_007666 [Talaromyces marneffei]QGA17529.1 hypothetical protein EYB26_005200 [Talaromyces marneffei]
MAEGGEAFNYFAKVTFGIICFIWFLATIFCTPVGRWLRNTNPRARRTFHYNPARAAGDDQGSYELEELDSARGRSSRGRARKVIDVNALNNWPREAASGSRSSATAEYEFEF